MKEHGKKPNIHQAYTEVPSHEISCMQDQRQKKNPKLMQAFPTRVLFISNILVKGSSNQGNSSKLPCFTPEGEGGDDFDMKGMQGCVSF